MRSDCSARSLNLRLGFCCMYQILPGAARAPSSAQRGALPGSLPTCGTLPAPAQHHLQAPRPAHFCYPRVTPLEASPSPLLPSHASHHCKPPPGPLLPPHASRRTTKTPTQRSQQRGWRAMPCWAPPSIWAMPFSKQQRAWRSRCTPGLWTRRQRCTGRDQGHFTVGLLLAGRGGRAAGLGVGHALLEDMPIASHGRLLRRQAWRMQCGGWS